MNANKLKIIALVSMFCDHVSRIFPMESVFESFAERLISMYPQGADRIADFFLDTLPLLLSYFGRLAAPLFMFCLTLGFRYTKDIRKYLARLLVFAVIAQLPYILFFQGIDRAMGLDEITPFYEIDLNILFTLATGLGALTIYERAKESRPKLALLPVAAAMVLANLLNMEGYWTYILYIFAFYATRDLLAAEKAAVWIPVILIGRWKLIYMALKMPNFTWVNTVLINTLGVYLAVPLTFLYNGEKGKSSKFWQYGAYLFYPVHLLVLGWLGFIYPIG